MKAKLTVLFSAVTVALAAAPNAARANMCPTFVTFCVDNCPVDNAQYCQDNYHNANCQITNAECNWWFNGCPGDGVECYLQNI